MGTHYIEENPHGTWDVVSLAADGIVDLLAENMPKATALIVAAKMNREDAQDEAADRAARLLEERMYD